MTAALDDNTRKALQAAKFADFQKQLKDLESKEDIEDEYWKEQYPEDEEYEGGNVTPKSKKKRVGFEKKKSSIPTEFDSNASDSAPQEGSIQRRHSNETTKNMQKKSIMPDYYDDDIINDMAKYAGVDKRFNIDEENVQIRNNMTMKGKTLESYVIYSKYRKIKDRNKLRAMTRE